MAPEIYRTPPQPPPVFTATPEYILAETKKLNDATKAVLDKIVVDVTPDNATFANVMHPMLEDGNEAAALQRTLTFYQHVSTNDELRAASNEAEEAMDKFGIECQMREDVFKVVDAAYATRDSQKLDKESLHILEKARQSYIRNGLRLEGPKRDRFKEIQEKLSQLQIKGQKNLNEEKGAIWFTPEQLEGVPADDIDVEKLEKGTGENEGKVKLSFKYNHFFPLIKYAKDAETRHRYTVAEANKVRCSRKPARAAS
jgi:metallopeptidase MepB